VVDIDNLILTTVFNRSPGLDGYVRGNTVYPLLAKRNVQHLFEQIGAVACCSPMRGINHGLDWVQT
jgi:hypothetical protein